MNHDPEQITGICGLFCGTCPSFADGICGGCLSGRVSETCAVCRHGFRDCAREHGIVRCSECGDFPCEMLERFRDAHIVDGISHHERILEYVRRQKEIGVAAWVREQEKLNACPVCKTLLIWCERRCRNCGSAVFKPDGKA